MSQDFWEKFWLTALDKAAIGGLIVLGGYYLNRSVEKIKSDYSFKNEVAKRRIEALSKCWQSIYEFEYCNSKILALVEHMHQNVAEDERSKFSDDVIAPMKKQLDDDFMKAQETMTLNRWFIHKDFERIKEYFYQLDSYSNSAPELIADGKIDEVKALKRDLDARKKSVLDETLS